MKLSHLSAKPVLALCCLSILSGTCFSLAEKRTSNTNSHVRLMKNSDGSTTEFKRDINNTTLEKNTYREDARGEKVIISKTVYERDKQGRLRNGVIEDGQRVKLYTIRYGYDAKTGRLIAENMFDARTIRRNDPKDPSKETPVRALRYSYDAQGNRSAPLVYSGLAGRSAEELQDWLKVNKFEKGTFPDVDPFSPTTVNPNAKRLSN